MKICPSCGAEIDEQANKCPICDFIFSETPDVSSEKAFKQVPEIDVASKLAEMKAKLQRLSITPKEPPVERPEEPEKPEEEPLPPAPAIEPPEEEEITEEPEAAPVEEVKEEIEKEITEEMPEPAEAEIISPPAEPSPTEDEASEEISDEDVEYEEIVIEEIRQPGSGAINGIGILLGKDKTPKKPDKLGRKISLEEVNKGRKKGIRGAHAAVAIIIVVIVIFASWFLLFNKPVTVLPGVDGVLDEWDNVVKYASYISSDDQNLNFLESAVQLYGGSILWYFHMSGELYKTSDRITSYALFVDADGDSSSGFAFSRDFGADNMIIISGTGGQKLSQVLYRFDSNDHNNWSEWQSIRTISVATLISQGETNFTVPASFSENDALFVAVAFDGKAKPSMTVYHKLLPGVLVVSQESMVPSACILDQQPSQQVLLLNVKAFGANRATQSIAPLINGEISTSIGSVIWDSVDQMETGRTLSVTVNCASMSAGTAITAEIQRSGITTDYPAVMILGRSAIGYVESIPNGITIDGCFADWTDFDIDMGDVVPISNENIDITKTSKDATASDLYFFAEVLGLMCKGYLIPVEETQVLPGGNGGIGVVEPRVTGEDLLRIYIDVDPASDSGAPSPVNETLEPDFMIEVGGRNSIITHRMFFEWNDEWIPHDDVQIDAAIDSRRMEISIEKDIIGSINGSDIAFVTTDWLGFNDDYTVSSVVIDPFKINLVGDVWGSLDGTSWVPKADVLNTTSSLMDLTSDDLGYLYAVFSNGTVYRSIDFAISWSRFIEGSLTDIVAITSDKVEQIYSITIDGTTYNASISGGPWTFRGDIGFAADIVDMDWAAGTTPDTTYLYALRSAPNVKIARSVDGGVTWTQFGIRPPTDTVVSSLSVVEIMPEHVFYVLERDGEIRVSNDTTASWTLTQISSGGNPDFVTCPCVDLDTDSNNNLWVVRSNGEVYRLVVSTWTWETLYITVDGSDINAISGVPIPEFSEVAIIIFLTIIPVIILSRQARRKN